MMTREQILRAAVETLRVLWHSKPGDDAAKLLEFGRRFDPDREVRSGWLTVDAEMHLRWMVAQMLESISADEPPTMPHRDRMSDEKLNRWLGFIQGAVWARGDTTINHLRLVNLWAQRPGAAICMED